MMFHFDSSCPFHPFVGFYIPTCLLLSSAQMKSKADNLLCDLQSSLLFFITVPVPGGTRHHTRGAQESAHRLRKRKYIPRVHVREARFQ